MNAAKRNGKAEQCLAKSLSVDTERTIGRKTVMPMVANA
jgi:hypothetical protein